MGKAWVTGRDAARQRVLSPGDKEVREVAEGWEQFLEYLTRRLHQSLGNPRLAALAHRANPFLL